jgi:hypothetical protein
MAINSGVEIGYSWRNVKVNKAKRLFITSIVPYNSIYLFALWIMQCANRKSFSGGSLQAA